MVTNDDNRPTEYIIVKRDSGHEEGHHGGAWKIAFADFMTAMMALFLVLWLINAANEQTLKAVASYFNPVKLVDRSRGDKGINEAGGPTETAAEAEKKSEAHAAPNVPIDIPAIGESTDEQLFANPDGVLDSLATEFAQAHKGAGNGDSAESEGPNDPFVAQYWVGKKREKTTRPEETPKADAPTEPDADRFGANADAQMQSGEAMERRAEKIGVEVEAALREALGPKAQSAMDVEVTVADKGVVISVTDAIKSSMFRIGSAVPNGQLVVAMSKIGEIIARYEGRIRINGHTDGRQYSGGQYDNWRLSSARAQAAYHMLVRGGLDEKRVAQVSGFADRELKRPDDPNADVNRRIEIFIETVQ